MATPEEKLFEYLDLIGRRDEALKALALRSQVLSAELSLAELRAEADAAAVALIGERNTGINQSELSLLFGYSRANAGRVVARHQRRANA